MHEDCVARYSSKLLAKKEQEIAPHEVNAFRPHVTLDWNDNGIHVPNSKRIIEAVSVSTTMVAWCIFQYTKDKLRRGVQTIFTEDLL